MQVCERLRLTSLTHSSRKSIRSLYKHYVADGGEQIVTFLHVQKQPDGHNCGPFAIAEILDGRSPSEALFDVNKMREHLITCLEMQRLTRFLKFPINRYILTLFAIKFVLICQPYKLNSFRNMFNEKS